MVGPPPLCVVGPGHACIVVMGLRSCCPVLLCLPSRAQLERALLRTRQPEPAPASTATLQIYAQFKYFLPDPVANDVKYQVGRGAGKGALVCCLVGLPVGIVF